MAVALSCSKCGKNYANIPPKFYGKRIRCRQCDAMLIIPNPSSSVEAAELPPVRRKRRTQAAGGSNPAATTTRQSGPANRKKKKRKSETGRGWSLWKVYAALVVFIFAAGWTEMAAEYARHTEEWTPAMVEMAEDELATRARLGRSVVGSAVTSLGSYLWNGVTQFGSFPQVIYHGFTHKLWLPITVIIVQVVCFFGVVGASMLEKKHAAEERRFDELSGTEVKAVAVFRNDIDRESCDG